MPLNGTMPASAPRLLKKSAAMAPPGLRNLSPQRSSAAWIGLTLVVRWWNPFCQQRRKACRPFCASSPRIRSPSAPSSAANTAFDWVNAKGSNGNALVGATSPSVAPAIKNSRAPTRRSANIWGAGRGRLSGNTARRNSPPVSRLIASAISAARRAVGLPAGWSKPSRYCFASDILSTLRQPEHALANDVALDLAGAAGDRVLGRAQHPVEPARGVGPRLGGAVDHRVGAEQRRREVGDAHPELGTEELEDRALGPRRLAAQSSRQTAQPRHLQCLGLDRQLGQLLADMGLVPRWLLPRRQLLGELDQPRDLFCVVASTSPAALEHQGRDRDLPALVQRPDEVGLWHRHVDKEHLVEMAVPVQQHQRPHRDPRRLHVDQ